MRKPPGRTLCLLTLALILMAMGGCGQKGPLFLPEKPAALTAAAVAETDG